MGGRNGGTWTAASHAAAVRAHVRPSSASLVTTSRLAVWPAPCAAASDRVEAGAPRPAACTATRTGTHACAPPHARAHRCAHTRALPHVQHTRAHGCAHVHTPHARAHLCARTCSLHAHGHWRRGHTRSSIPINSGKNSPTPGAPRTSTAGRRAAASPFRTAVQRLQYRHHAKHGEGTLTRLATQKAAGAFT